MQTDQHHDPYCTPFDARSTSSLPGGIAGIDDAGQSSGLGIHTKLESAFGPRKLPDQVRMDNRDRRTLELLEKAEVDGDSKGVRLSMLAFLRHKLPSSTGKFQTMTGKVKPEFRTKFCLSFVRGDKGLATYQYSEEAGRAGLYDVNHCGSVWTCPVCGERITAERRGELKRLLAVNDKYMVIMSTYTLSHHEGEALSPMVDALNQAVRRTKTGRPWRRFIEKWGIIGHVDALEVTHGKNGWHPHKHEMLVIDRSKLGVSGPEAKNLFEEELRNELFSMYHHKLNQAGRECDAEHGLVVTANRREYGDYIAKWGVTEELTRSVNKAASGGGRSVWELLKDSMRGDLQAWALWLEYCRAFKGKKQLHWSKGLRELLELEAEQSDQEIADTEDAPSDRRVIFSVSQMGLNYIHSKDLDGPIRAFIEFTHGDVNQVMAYLARMGLREYIAPGHDPGSL